MAELVLRKGNTWNSTGIIRNGKVLCFIEETLFLAEIGAFKILNDDNTILPMREIYGKALEAKNGCLWESFEAYKRLKSLGYIIGRHGISWSVKSVGTILPPEGLSDIDKKDFESIESTHISKTFTGMQRKEVQPIFDVYNPSSKFKKSSPGHPSFVLCLARGQPPSKQEVEDLENRCGCPLKFCKVDVGRTSFFSIDRVELPALP
ncbi:OLC1v1033763C2 [Oldenlandia corymbosa var. corymbosa]|nr:OLC1v1033763C2 [Oldenlandia corymbosa var. corymbosa]